MRGNTGTLLDLWHFQRGDERLSVTARGWLAVDNAHRDVLRDCAIVRLFDWHQRPGYHIATGLLQPVLADWQLSEVPRVNLLYPPSARRLPRVRAFIDFVTRAFRDIDQQRQRRGGGTEPPQRLKSRFPRSSSTLKRRATE